MPVVPKTDARYKTLLCMFHKQGRCPRGDTCSFAHGISELRKKPKQQVIITLSHQANIVFLSSKCSNVTFYL